MDLISSNFVGFPPFCSSLGLACLLAVRPTLEIGIYIHVHEVSNTFLPVVVQLIPKWIPWNSHVLRLHLDNWDLIALQSECLQV